MIDVRSTTGRCESADGLALDRQLCFALYSASLAMTHVYRALLAPLGLTYPQYLVMMVLWEGDRISLTELGARLQLDSGTLTPLLKRLAAAGLLRRNRDPADERRVRLELTARGRALRKRAAAVPAAATAATGLKAAEFGKLIKQLERLRINLSSAAN